MKIISTVGKILFVVHKQVFSFNQKAKFDEFLTQKLQFNIFTCSHFSSSFKCVYAHVSSLPFSFFPSEFSWNFNHILTISVRIFAFTCEFIYCTNIMFETSKHANDYLGWCRYRNSESNVSTNGCRRTVLFAYSQCLEFTTSRRKNGERISRYAIEK